MPTNSRITLLRSNAVLKRTAFPRSTLYKKINEGLFVPPINIGGRSIAWIENEIDQILSAMVSGSDDSAIAELVRSLISQRTEKSEAMVA